MTFCGELLSAHQVVTFTRLRAVRRKGRNGHRPVQLSGRERKNFWPDKKFSGERLQPSLDSQAVCGCLSPGVRTHARETTGSRNPPQRREARARNGVAPYIPPCVLAGCTERRRRRD
ncbi:hypothetical protein C1N58_22400 (plasmid) [Pantoea sp. SGAir0180]